MLTHALFIANTGSSFQCLLPYALAYKMFHVLNSDPHRSILMWKEEKIKLWVA